MRSIFILATLAAFFVSACGNLDTKTSASIKSTSATQTLKFMPDNDLWKEDGFVNGDVTQEIFNEIIGIAKEVYAPVAEQWKEELNINALWDDATVNANATRDGHGWTEINMYGGLARRVEVIPEGFALVLCHEISHLYGGKPYVEVSLKMAAEGQADYMGAGWCLKNVVEKMSAKGIFTTTDYMKRVCNDNEICIRQLGAGVSLGNLLSKLNGDKTPNLETPDTSVVRKTNTSYPKTTQCRVDTYLRGTLGQDRPLCWYKP